MDTQSCAFEVQIVLVAFIIFFSFSTLFMLTQCIAFLCDKTYTMKYERNNEDLPPTYSNVVRN